MRRLYPVDDFEAIIRIFSEAERGRKSPVMNGIRWDLAYADATGPVRLHMVWPDFFDARGDSLSADTPLPTGVPLPARMWILVDEMREQVHRGRIRPETEFFCHEGGRRVAHGRVTRITGLYDDRPMRR